MVKEGKQQHWREVRDSTSVTWQKKNHLYSLYIHSVQHYKASVTWNNFSVCFLSTWTVGLADGWCGCSWCCSGKDALTHPSPRLISSLLLFYESVCWALIGFIAGLIVSHWSSAAPVVMGPHYHRPRFTRMQDERSAEHGVAAFPWLHDRWFQKAQLEAVLLMTFQH